MKSVGSSHGSLSLLCLWWRWWWSNTLWVSLIRFYDCTLFHVHVQIIVLETSLCNFIEKRERAFLTRFWLCGTDSISFYHSYCGKVEDKHPLLSFLLCLLTFDFWFVVCGRGGWLVPICLREQTQIWFQESMKVLYLWWHIFTCSSIAFKLLLIYSLWSCGCVNSTGGLKLWECTIDLVETLHGEIKDGQLSFEGKHVLEVWISVKKLLDLSILLKRFAEECAYAFFLREEYELQLAVCI
jgi:hypothetical protein